VQDKANVAIDHQS